MPAQVKRIDFVCDDHRHTGKVAQVASFTYDQAIGEWLGPFTLSRRGRVVFPKQQAYQRPGETAAEVRPNVVGRRTPLSHRMPCPLCPQNSPQKLECTDETLRALLKHVASLGESSISLRKLNMLVSKAPKQ